MLLNELAQWASLLVLGIFVLGLTRQLGDFLVPPRELLADNRGPRAGKRLPPELLSLGGRQSLEALMRERESDWAALLIVDEDCPRCEVLLDRLPPAGSLDGATLVALSSDSSAGHRARLERVVDFVVVDGPLLDRADLTVKPFVVLVDRSLKVRSKQVTWDLQEAVRAWTGQDDTAAPQRSTPPAVDGLAITHIEGRSS